MKKLRTLVVVHASLVPPDSLEGFTDKQIDEWRTEYDVMSTLRAMGHEVRCLGVLDSLTELRVAISDWKPDIVFNLLEEFNGIVTYDQHVVAFLELLQQPYTGCNPRGLLLARDKALSKTLLASHRIPVPEFAVFRLGKAVKRPRRLAFPLIVKSLTKEGSEGIAQDSIVTDDERLAERVRFVHERLGTHAIAERFIDGRELYVGVVGNDRLQVFPVWELLFERLPEGAPRIATERVKWSRAYQEKVGVKTAAAKSLPDELRSHIDRLVKRIFRTLQLSGYARIDLRLDAEGRVYVLEANPNPQIAYGEDFAESAEHAGIKYGELLQRIISLGMRWSPETRG